VVRVRGLGLVLYIVLTKVKEVRWLGLKGSGLKRNYSIKINITLKSALLSSKPGRKSKFC